MNKKLLALPALMLAATVVLGGTASAESTPVVTNLGANAVVTVGTPVIRESGDVKVRAENDTDGDRKIDIKLSDDMRRMMSGVFGTVTAVNGSTITVQTKAFVKGSLNIPAATYTVTTSSTTTVDKNKAANSVAAIAVGDTVIVEGTVSGSTVAATKIHDGVMMKGGDNKGAILDGNGQPIVGGTVTAISGNTITITNKSNVTYSIDASNAKITKNSSSTSISSIAVGDNLLIQGSVNGNSVVAASIIDGNNPSGKANNGQHRGFFGSIGNFFSHLFGFGK